MGFLRNKACISKSNIMLSYLWWWGIISMNYIGMGLTRSFEAENRHKKTGQRQSIIEQSGLQFFFLTYDWFLYNQN